MPSVRIVTEGPYAVWDPESPAAFEELAGDQFVERDGEKAVIVTEAGTQMPVYPGWAAVQTAGGVRFVTPEVLASGTIS